MARHKNAIRPVVVQVKFTLIPGLHDWYIDYFNRLPDGQRAAALLRDLKSGAAQPAAVDDDTAFEDALTNLID